MESSSDPLSEIDLRHYMWRKGDLSWKLWPQQIKIYNAVRDLPHDVGMIVALCARQLGKSFMGTLMAVEDCLKYPGFTVPVVGPTIKQTVDIVHQAMRIIIDDAPPGLIRRSKSETRWYIGDSELVVGGFDTQTATRQRGKRALKIYVEEVVDSNPDQYREAIRSDLGPMLTHSPDPRMIFLTTPPRVPDHPFITETIPEAKLNGAFFCYTIDDNEKLSQDQYEACVRRSGGRNTIEFRREYLCEIVRDTAIVVVPDFDSKRHISSTCELPQYCKPQVSIDWGGSRDLTVALLHAYDYMSDTDLVVQERVFGPNTPSNKVIPILLEMERGLEVTRVADAMGQLGIELAANGYTVSAPNKSDWQANINFMNVRFSMGKIAINPRCRFLIQSLESGTFNKHKTDFERTEALGHCDALAALMYGLRSENRENPMATGRMTFVDTLNPYFTRKSPEQEAFDGLSTGTTHATFGPSVYRPKKFGRFGGG